MLATTDRAFLGVLFCLCWNPVFFLVLTGCLDSVASVVFCVYVLVSVRLIASGCIFVKSAGYVFASAPIFLFLDAHGDHAALGVQVPAAEL